MSTLMLKGWTMLGDNCPVTGKARERALETGRPVLLGSLVHNTRNVQRPSTRPEPLRWCVADRADSSLFVSVARRRCP
eukprot:6198635-Pleurochrysis_carterae.AAC.3